MRVFNHFSMVSYVLLKVMFLMVGLSQRPFRVSFCIFSRLLKFIRKTNSMCFDQYQVVLWLWGPP